MFAKNIPLKDVAKRGGGPATPGVYILRLNGRVMKVGSAEIGVQKRMQQYYGLNEHCGLNRFIDNGNKDLIRVDYQLCPVDGCRELESKLFDKYGPVSKLPWAERRPNFNQNKYVLEI